MLIYYYYYYYYYSISKVDFVLSRDVEHVDLMRQSGWEKENLWLNAIPPQEKIDLVSHPGRSKRVGFTLSFYLSLSLCLSFIYTHIYTHTNLLVQLRICYITCKGIKSTPKKNLLGFTLNCIWWWGSSSGYIYCPYFQAHSTLLGPIFWSDWSICKLFVQDKNISYRVQPPPKKTQTNKKTKQNKKTKKIVRNNPKCKSNRTMSVIP